MLPGRRRALRADCRRGWRKWVSTIWLGTASGVWPGAGKVACKQGTRGGANLVEEGGRGSGKATIDYCCPRPTTRTPSITHPSAWAITCFPHPRSDQGPHMLPALLDLSGERDAKDLSCSTPCRLMRFPTRQNRPALQTPLGGVFWPRAMCAIGQGDRLAAHCYRSGRGSRSLST